MMSEWQPIETAPFDDTYILVLLKGHFPKVAYHYNDSFGSHVSSTDVGDSVWDNEFDDIATHWLPIPSPPPTPDTLAEEE